MNGKIALFSLFLAALMSIPAISWIDETEADLLDEGSLQSHDPIVIDGDEDFTAANGVRGGSGTEADPYIIENWSIDSKDANGISIKDISKNTVLRNCRIDGIFLQDNNSQSEHVGIHIERSANISLDHNVVSGHYKGMFVYRSNEIIIFGNDMNRNKWAGLEVMRSDNLTVRMNDCSNNSRSGIMINIVNDSIFDRNECKFNQNGIYIEPHPDDTHLIDWNTRSWRLSIINNSCKYNTIGINIDGLNDSVIEDNECDMNYWGYHLRDEEDILFEGNNAKGDIVSLTIHDTIGCVFRNNEFDNAVDILGGGEWPLKKEDIDRYYLSNEFIDNNIDGKPLIYLKNMSDIKLNDPNSGEIILANCSDIRITNMDFKDKSRGIQILNGGSIEIDNCTFTNIVKGIESVNDRIVIKDCLFLNSYPPKNARISYFAVSVIANYYEIIHNGFDNLLCGIDGHTTGIGIIRGNDFDHVDSCVQVDGNITYVEDNQMVKGVQGLRIANGVYWREDSTGSVSGNYIDSFSEYGINTFPNYDLFDNVITNCNEGIELYYEPGNGTVQGNHLISNKYGISVHSLTDIRQPMSKIFGNNISFSEKYAIRIDQDSPYKIPADMIYGNTFYENNLGGIQALDKSSGLNLWNVSDKGNFWSDYSSRYPDATIQDGHWSIPYEIDGGKGNMDYLPLVNNPIGSILILTLSKKNIEKAYVGVLYENSYNIAYTGTKALSWSFTTNASWLSFDDEHNLTGRPEIEDQGTFWANISVSDGEMTDGTNFTIIVELKDFAPLITTVDVTSVDQWQPYRVDYNATDSQTDLEWKLVVDGNSTFLKIDPVTGVLSGTPGLNDVDVVHVNVSVNDGELYAIHHFDLTVRDVNDPPMMNESFRTLTMEEDGTLVLTIGEVFFNYDNDPMTITAATSENIEYTVSRDTITIEPALNYHGKENISFSVSDGHYDKMFEISLEVRTVNDPPSDLIITFGSETFIEGGSQIIRANFSDADMDDLNITWYLDGTIIGYGSILNLSLMAGMYNLTLRVTDPSGAFAEASRMLVIGSQGIETNRPDYTMVYVGIGIALIVLIVSGSLVIILRRRSRGEDTSESITDGIEGHVPTPFDKDLPLAPAPAMSASVKLGSLDGGYSSLPDGKEFDYAPGQGNHDIPSLRRRLNMMQDDGGLTQEELGRIVVIMDRIEE